MAEQTYEEGITSIVMDGRIMLRLFLKISKEGKC